MAKLTTEEMLEALNRLPEEEKGWSDVQRALSPNAPERAIKKAFDKRCPEAKIPELVAWQKYNQAQERIHSIHYQIAHYWDDPDLGTFGAAQACTEAEKQEYEQFKKNCEKEIEKLVAICDQNEEGFKAWKTLTRG